MSDIIRNGQSIGKIIRNGVAYGGSSSPDYITDGLVFLSSNEHDSTKNKVDFTPAKSFSTNGMTIEMCCKVTAMAQNYSRVIQVGEDSNKFICFGLTKVSAEIGNNSDYGPDIFISYSSSTDHDFYPKPDDLSFNAVHTFSLVFNNNLTKVYIDGVELSQSETLATGLSLSADEIYMMYGSVSSRETTGEWYNARVYNRALTASEITANHAVDVSRYS